MIGKLEMLWRSLAGHPHWPWPAPDASLAPSPPLPQVLASVQIKDPRIPVYSNVTGKPFKDAKEIAALLPRQLVEPVRWEPSIRALLAAGG